jgi:hypothetical protein
MISMKLNPRETADLLAALERAFTTYIADKKAATDVVDIHLAEAREQRVSALHHKLSKLAAAQPAA